MLCAVRGAAVYDYCAAAAPDDAARSTVTAFTYFRRLLVDADVVPQFEMLLLQASRNAVQTVAGARLDPQVRKAAEGAFAGALARQMPSPLAKAILHSMIAVAPVVAHDGDVSKVCAEADQRYAATFADAARRRRELVAPAIARPVERSPWVPRQLIEPAMLHAEAARAVAIDADAEPLGEAEVTSEAEGGVEPNVEGQPRNARNHEADALARSPWLVPFKPRISTSVSTDIAVREPQFGPSGEAPAAAPKPRSRLSFKRAGRRWFAAVVTALAIASVVSAVILLGRSDPDQLTVSQQLKTPFSAAGARFEVKPVSRFWAAKLRERPPRSGHRWVTLAVATRNVSRADFRPLSFGYRLITSSGNVVAPDSASLREGSVNSRGQLPRGQRSSVHLGFQVPVGASDLALAFEPAGPESATTVRVRFVAER